MIASDSVAEIVERSGLPKAQLCQRSGISRSSLDDYLKGRTQPSVEQVARLAEAAGLRPRLVLDPIPPAVPQEFVAVLEFGDIFPRRPKPPPVNLGPVWRSARRRAEGREAR